jgi:hypothetical protein
MSPPRALQVGAALLLACSAAASAEWPDDPYANLAIADRTSEQVLPLIAPTSDGGCYVAWFDLASGNYDVYLQRLDRMGIEAWPHNGVLISDHAQSSSLVTWDMTVDSNDNAVLIFSDTRAGDDLDNYAYMVSPAGDLLWGTDGVTLSTNEDYEPGGCVTEASDGDLVFVWARQPDSGDGDIRMQRLSPTGVERFAHSGIAIAGAAGETPAFPDVVPSFDGSVIASWVRDIIPFTAPRHFRAQRFAADGTSVWATYVNIFDATSVPAGYDPAIQSDHAGGVVCAWHASVSNMHSSRFQHLTSNGLELFVHNGLPVSTLSTQHHIDPTLAYDPDTGDAYVFWNERNGAQSQWGIYGQRVSDLGVRMWGDSGLVFLPVNTLYKSFPRAVPCTDGAMVFWSDQPIGGYAQDRLVGMRVNSSGTQVWPGSPIEVSALLSNKARYPVIINDAEMAVLVWEDGRAGTPDLYGQNVNADGTLGAISTHVEPAVPADSRLALRSAPNPFHGATRFVLGTQEVLPDARIDVLDSAGRLVRRLALGDLPAGEARSMRWDGTDARGERLPAGFYHYRLVSGDRAGAAGGVILLD